MFTARAAPVVNTNKLVPSTTIAGACGVDPPTDSQTPHPTAVRVLTQTVPSLARQWCHVGQTEIGNGLARASRQPEAPPRKVALTWSFAVHPVRDLNPCYHLERVAS